MYQPKTGEKCTCKRGVQRNNCPNCEGTGWEIDFRAIHARRMGEELEAKLQKALDEDNENDRTSTK